MELENENQCGGCSPEISHFWVEDWAALIEELCGSIWRGVL
jgi:hypothetical protein